MKIINAYKICLLVTASLIFCSSFLVSQNTPKPVPINYKDTVLHSYSFITIAEADKILGKSSYLSDSSFKYSGSLLRYKFDYAARYKDSTSKGKIFFMFEQYADLPSTKSIYNNLKVENEKTSKVTELNGTIGDEGFLAKDNFNYPFVLIRKENKLFKFKLYYLDGKVSLDELMKVAKKIVASH